MRPPPAFPSPFLVLDRGTVLRYLREAGTQDPDLLHERKARLLARGGFLRPCGIVTALLGGALAGSPVGPAFGLPLVGLGAWLWRRGARNRETIESGFAEFVGEARA